MPIGPAAKGIIIVGGVIIAAGIAVYENPQVREWLETNRRKASEAFNDWLDSLDPQRSRQAQAYGASPEGRQREGATHAGYPPTEQFALERRRLGEEYLEQRRRKMEEYKEKKRQSSLEPLVHEDGTSDVNQADAQTVTVTARESKLDPAHLRQRIQVDERTAPEGEHSQNNANLDMSNARIQISFSQADIMPEVYSKAGDNFTFTHDNEGGVSMSLPTQEAIADEPSTPRLPAQAQARPELEFSTPVLSLDLSQGQASRELYQTAPTPETYTNRSLPHTPSTVGSEVFFSRSTSDIGFDESASQRDVDMLSDVGPETPSGLSRTSSFGHINGEEDRGQNADREDDVVSVASSWSAISSRVSEH